MINLRQYAPGEPIIRENEPGECAYVIEKGKVEITKDQGGRAVHIAFLESGMTFGEMSLVDDLPRSATVTAVEETTVRMVHRDELYEALKSNPETMGKLLKGIFERLRIANSTISRLKEALKAAHAAAPDGYGEGVEAAGLPAGSAAAFRPAAGVPPPAKERPASAFALPIGADSRSAGRDDFSARPGRPSAASISNGRIKTVRIEGLTARAAESLPDNPSTFAFLPIKVGRKTNDPMVHNHLEIADRDPLQVSRHHLSIIQENGKVGVLDRGSQLGASLDGRRIGGGDPPGPVFFDGDEATLVIGTDNSPYRYRVTVAR